MKDIIDILCWFANLLRGFFKVLGLDEGIIDDLTGKFIEMGNK